MLTLLQVGVSFAEPLNQADLNGLEQSVDKPQNSFHEIRATNQCEFASQQHPPRPSARLQATPISLHIYDRNSFLVLQYKPDNEYELVIEEYDVETPIRSGMQSSLVFLSTSTSQILLMNNP